MAELKMLDHTLALARVGLAASAAERQRLRAALALGRIASPVAGQVFDPMAAPAAGQALEAATRGWGSGSAVGLGALPSSGWTAIKASGKAGLIAGALLMGAGFAGGYWVGQRESLPAPTVSTALTEAMAAAPATANAPVPASEAGQAAPPSAGLPELDAMPPSTGSTPNASVARALDIEKAPRRRDGAGPGLGGSKSADAFDQEMALLQRVERALRNEDPALVVSLLSELDARHPRGVLSEERRAARVMARCQAKELNADLAAQRFLHAMPNSVYTDRVRSLCEPEVSTQP